ncbi:Acetyltransferase (GNAT) family protein [Maribacter sedimenticola]|uniref:Acetyltransferase (GNAT) family protein n=1 Tax=Maribacter sedimenticola TaxID=228956 RepID=A0ABY1SIY5_9FLAO|nr:MULTISPECIES: GNAT family N-acetyltransferase [Maribacter]TVZ15997.1 acetyltransferase (GNAT) family protein [Maribacter sp. MAR_2009_72]SNR58813.1 Acetyltransferase (GNAT) family protein [Maribacter sedimenticola]
MIELAKISELNEILHLTDACRIAMENKGIYQWTTDYPSRKAFLNDLDRNELFTLKNQQTIIGCIVISTYMDTEYSPVSWLTPNGLNYYIHRLAVHPNFQGKGFAQRLMDFGEDFAKKNKALSIRLDTFSQNKRNQKFYEQRGYKRLEDIFFPQQSPYPFHCYELVL